MPFQRFLSSNPRALRCFVLALALLQFVAPTWHICEIGGHSTHHRLVSGAKSHHDQARANRDSNQPLICFCAPHQKTLDPKTPQLDGISQGDHATCLALLLQTMPGQTGAPLAVFDSRVVTPASFGAARRQIPVIAGMLWFRGRAPPRKC